MILLLNFVLLLGIAALLFAKSVTLHPLLALLYLALPTFAICFYVKKSRHDKRSLYLLVQAAQRFSEGQLDMGIALTQSSDLNQLADHMNKMAKNLDQRLKVLLRQSKEQEAVLSSMLEGVLAIGSDGRLLKVNQAALQLLGMPPMDVVGRSVEEIVRNNRLQRFVKKALASSDPLEGDMLLYDRTERFVQAYGSPLTDADGTRIGALIVLNDITKLRQLENIRRDFVANVSHELRTPITSIKGFVETLRDGAIANPLDANRFLEIISRQADRLNAIFDDLLKLSRIEQDRDQNQIELSSCNLSQLLSETLQSRNEMAVRKGIHLELKVESPIQALVNASLIEQAVLNLVDNAIRHSEQGKSILVMLHENSTDVIISVADQGSGIEKRHLARLFERFYRVDKARSRDSGGTGLGLAIVKHIAQAHGGFPKVESEIGRGSIFSIHLPKRSQLQQTVNLL